MDIQQLLPVIVPLLILQVVLIVAALWDMTRPERRVKGGSKLLWGIVVILFGILGPLVYFFFGREDA